jgi:hypothetical protein
VDDLDAEGAARWLNCCLGDQPAISSAALPLTFLSAIRLWPMSIRPCFVKWEIRPGLAPCSMTAVGPFSFHVPSHPAQVHVAPVEGLLRRVLVRAAGVGVPQLGRGVDVEDAVVVAPLQDLAGVDVPGQVDQQVAGGQVLAEQRAMFSSVTGRGRIARPSRSTLQLLRRSSKSIT